MIAVFLQVIGKKSFFKKETKQDFTKIGDGLKVNKR